MAIAAVGASAPTSPPAGNSHRAAQTNDPWTARPATFCGAAGRQPRSGKGGRDSSSHQPMTCAAAGNEDPWDAAAPALLSAECTWGAPPDFVGPPPPSPHVIALLWSDPAPPPRQPLQVDPTVVPQQPQMYAGVLAMAVATSAAFDLQPPPPPGPPPNWVPTLAGAPLPPQPTRVTHCISFAPGMQPPPPTTAKSPPRQFSAAKKQPPPLPLPRALLSAAAQPQTLAPALPPQAPIYRVPPFHPAVQPKDPANPIPSTIDNRLSPPEKAPPLSFTVPSMPSAVMQPPPALGPPPPTLH
mmetsp:Transcript_20413/g.70704  ORF Transcript_20413/g.70704 Transcript_20413/m.70704 type:complete len:298 (-) Transcript_20413:178-1071(-)